MTNREWLNGLSDEEFYKALKFDCTFLSLYGCKIGRCRKDEDCQACKIAWLKAEHKEKKGKR